MKVSDIYSFIDSFAPFSTQEDFDNAGLLAGDMDSDVTKIGLCLDITKENVEKAKKLGCDLIVAHHPVIFSPLKKVSFDSVPALLCKYGISAICAHTNLDKAQGGVADSLCKVLGLSDVKASESGFVRVGKLPTPMSAPDFAKYLKDRLGTSVNYKDNGKEISTVALCGGGGADFVDEMESDAYVTGEIKHHLWLDVPKSLFECGHFATEVVVVPALKEKLSEIFGDIVIMDEDCPYKTV